ncbi:serine/threonine-protein kinase VRK3 isoform X2 [Salarias fasciatus]|nr:inactive serine/threonine-protein kinase VRK3 isoform X2 [Salarias fasciatus]
MFMWMPFHFCPQCGVKLQPDFKFCPSCGEKLPCAADEPEPLAAAVSASVLRMSPVQSTEPTHIQASTRPPLRKTRKSLRFNSEANPNIPDAIPSVESSAHPLKDDKTQGRGVVPNVSSSEQHTVTFKVDPEVEPAMQSSPSPAKKSLRPVRRKSKLSTPEGKRPSEASEVDGSSVNVSTPPPPLKLMSPLKGKSKAKKVKRASAVEKLQEGEEVTDTTGKKWKLMKLLSQSWTELIYEVSHPNAKESNHVLKLGANDGRVFNEQNFLQRAAKPASVEKWIKQNKMDFLGIPSCVGFGRHADSYRFLIFPSMGQSLQSIIEEENKLLSEKVVLQLACRILDALEYLHSNEYVHTDINAENVYIKPGQKSQVYLVGYCHAFRYCPGGQHVEYREHSRMPHEGAIEFISLDAHKGLGPSRRSDLQSLGYCMLHWHTGVLPWAELTEPEQVATQKQRFLGDVPALLHLCFGKNKVSTAFQSYLTSVMALHYAEQPNYSALKSGLSDALLLLGGSVEEPLAL